MLNLPLYSTKSMWWRLALWPKDCSLYFYWAEFLIPHWNFQYRNIVHRYFQHIAPRGSYVSHWIWKQLSVSTHYICRLHIMISKSIHLFLSQSGRWHNLLCETGLDMSISSFQRGQIVPKLPAFPQNICSLSLRHRLFVWGILRLPNTLASYHLVPEDKFFLGLQNLFVHCIETNHRTAMTVGPSPSWTPWRPRGMTSRRAGPRPFHRGHNLLELLMLV